MCRAIVPDGNAGNPSRPRKQSLVDPATHLTRHDPKTAVLPHVGALFDDETLLTRQFVVSRVALPSREEEEDDGVVTGSSVALEAGEAENAANKETQIQNQPIPSELPFRIISRTIGKGAYAFIRKACPHNVSNPVIAVKFINKEHAYKLGRVKPKQLDAEIALHKHVGTHQNIIQFLATGEDLYWKWIAMELADGDLFDKIEADTGVGQDIAHFYFNQLISAVSYMHSLDVAHRDIKPENLLLADGDLKLADFGLAVLFGYKGQKKMCTTVCGSPPYMAPEVVPRGGFTGQRTEPYIADKADIWSCGIVLFVFLVGNTPWDEPTHSSYEFDDYVKNGPAQDDDLWTRIPHAALSLLKGMLKVDPAARMTLEEVRRHPWFTRANPHLRSDGRAANPIGLATQMLESLHIDFNADPMAPSQRGQRQSQPQHPADDMDLDVPEGRLALTQPETPVVEGMFDWEQPARAAAAQDGISASQPVRGGAYGREAPLVLADRYMDDPALSQFAPTPSVPYSLTQQARKFRDIIPETSLARFLSFMDFPLLMPLLCEALGRLNIQASVAIGDKAVDGSMGNKEFIQVKTRDTRNCLLVGTIMAEKLDEQVFEVRFMKAKGDPLEWRRLFKKVAVLCKDCLIRPDA